MPNTNTNSVVFDHLEEIELANRAPPDHSDPNHPHYPGDLDTQAKASPHLSVGKKIALGICAAVLFAGLLIGSGFAGARVGTPHRRPADPITSGSDSNSTHTSIQWHTATQTVTNTSTSVWETTTTITGTTHVTPPPISVSTEKITEKVTETLTVTKTEVEKGARCRKVNWYEAAWACNIQCNTETYKGDVGRLLTCEKVTGILGGTNCWSCLTE
ncbi:hypothetical protein P280DRAFT_484459 [Massarina eburnea CBS 473.64]|uniref:Uncharacterized protein n=1 Tax=Massarina eburnea CBS 473.64 TaxID=1395130 RepID=A0A6A6RN60_9PLEO|nr:hypothetical protein P280DRAFT_484459 [Massarina eburnea CBS 473.64]